MLLYILVEVHYLVYENQTSLNPPTVQQC